MNDTSAPSTETAALAVRRQLRAIGAERYDLQMVDAGTGEREIHLRRTPEEIERSLAWLREINAKGTEILIRAAGETPSVLVAEVSKERLAELGKRDLDPAAVVELSGGTSEVWLRHRAPLRREEAEVVGALLSQEIRGDRTREPERWGHLAGFTTPSAIKESSSGREAVPVPPALLLRSSGTVYARGEEIREAAGTLLLERRAERDFDGKAPFETTPGAGGRIDLASPDGLKKGFAAWLEAERHTFELAKEGRNLTSDTPLNDLVRREVEIVEALRQRHDLQTALEEATGLRPLPRLREEDIPRAIELRARFGEASRRLESAQDHAVVTGRSGLEGLRDEIHEFRSRAQEVLVLADQYIFFPTNLRPGRDLAEGALQIPPADVGTLLARSARLHEAIEQFRANPETAEWGEVRRAFVEKVDEVVLLENFRADFARAERALTRDHDGLADRLERVERGLGGTPSPEVRALYGQLVEDFEAVEGQLEAVRARLHGYDLASIEGSLDRIGLGLAGNATDRDASFESFRRFAEALAERREVAERWAGQDPEISREIRPLETPELAQAREHLAGAATLVLERRSPEDLAAYRAAAESVAGLESRGRDRATEIEFGAAHNELRLALREVRPATAWVEPKAIERFRTALDRFHAAEERFVSRLPAVPTELSREDRFGELLARVRRGDHTPETLAQFQRVVVLEIQDRIGQAPLPIDRVASRPSGLEGIGRYRQARVELAWELHRHGKGISQRDPQALDRLQPILARYQVAARELERATERFVRDPNGRVLPVRFFLRHPQFRDRPDRALAAWARHAAERGRSAPQLRAHLARAVPRSPLARSSVLSRPWIGRAALQGVRSVGRSLQRLVREEALSR